ncbi:MAG: DUF790 family protein [archaeon]
MQRHQGAGNSKSKAGRMKMNSLSIPLSALRYRRRGEDIVVSFLADDAQTRERLKKVIAYYDSFLGKKKADFDERIVTDAVGDLKTARGIMSVMGNFYSFGSLGFSDIFLPKDAAALKKKGIISPETLRGAVFGFVNQKYSGFAPLKKEALLEFRDANGLKSELDEALWLDQEEEKRLCKKREPKEEDIVKTYNLCLFGTIFLNSLNVDIMLPELDGSMVRKIYHLCKYGGLLCDVSITAGNNYVIEITGPFELAGKPEKYGHDISRVAFRIFDSMKDKDFSFRSAVFIKNRKLNFSMGSREMRNIGLIRDAGNEKETPRFDSAPEEKLYGFFSENRQSWDIKREPEPIITENFLYIPDFVYFRSKSKVYVEVMGYYTEHYQKKKIDKLKSLKDRGDIQMIIIANSVYDDEIKREIEDIGYPVVYFKGKDIPYGPVLRILEERFSDFDERIDWLKEGKEDIAVDIQRELKAIGFISDDKLRDRLGCFTDDEFEKCRNIVLEKTGGIYIRGAGLIDHGKMDELRSVADEAFSLKMDREYLKKRFLEKGIDVVEPVLGHMGYGIRWHGLGKTLIVKL